MQRKVIGEVELSIKSQTKILINIKICHLVSSIEAQIIGVVVAHGNQKPLAVSSETGSHNLSQPVNDSNRRMKLSRTLI